MAERKRREFSRRQPVRSYRKLYVIATEGAETEPEYFRMFQSKTATILLKIIDSRHDSSPRQVLKRVEQYMAKESLKRSDAVWLVLDRDTWEEEELNEVWNGCQGNHLHLALSNPCFEYWILLHFENGSGVSSKNTCLERLIHYLPNFAKKHVEIEKLRPNIQTAITHAKQKDIPPCTDWPHGNGSTVYRLVQELISMEGVRNS